MIRSSFDHAALNRAARRALLLGGLCVATAGVQAQAGVAGERQRVADERAAVEARFRAQEAACQQRFAVTDCVNDAKKERRDALTPLRRLDAALDDAQRKQRAAQRREAVARKLESAQTRDREVVVREAPAPAAAAASAVQPAAPGEVAAPAASAEASSAPAKARRDAKPKPSPKPTSARTPSAPLTAAERRAREEEAQARSAARKQSAQDHKEAVEQRNAERALRGKRVEPLPVPASGALP